MMFKVKQKCDKWRRAFEELAKEEEFKLGISKKSISFRSASPFRESEQDENGIMLRRGQTVITKKNTLQSVNADYLAARDTLLAQLKMTYDLTGPVDSEKLMKGHWLLKRLGVSVPVDDPARI